MGFLQILHNRIQNTPLQTKKLALLAREPDQHGTLSHRLPADKFFVVSVYLSIRSKVAGMGCVIGHHVHDGLQEAVAYEMPSAGSVENMPYATHPYDSSYIMLTWFEHNIFVLRSISFDALKPVTCRRMGIHLLMLPDQQAPSPGANAHASSIQHAHSATYFSSLPARVSSYSQSETAQHYLHFKCTTIPQLRN